uniref:Uncharacterized protein n=1 Tax=Hyaloperonospora arabidopsidis (strain Emoy2) TaxID=559515 RepID=M4B955_HYAAE
MAVVYENDEQIAVSKPPSMPTHPCGERIATTHCTRFYNQLGRTLRSFTSSIDSTDSHLVLCF